VQQLKCETVIVVLKTVAVRRLVESVNPSA
jgi:hypothetical protein